MFFDNKISKLLPVYKTTRQPEVSFEVKACLVRQ